MFRFIYTLCVRCNKLAHREMHICIHCGQPLSQEMPRPELPRFPEYREYADGVLSGSWDEVAA